MNMPAHAARSRLFVCRTCTRGEPGPPGGQTRGERLAADVVAQARRRSLDTRVVECLNACPRPCNVSLRASGRSTWRFSGVDHEHVDALLDFADRYATGAGDDALRRDCPPSLADKITACSPGSAAALAEARKDG